MLKTIFLVIMLAASGLAQANSSNGSPFLGGDSLRGFYGENIDFNADYDWSRDLPKPSGNESYGIKSTNPRDYIVQKKYQRVNVLTVDTRDQVTCQKIALQLRQSSSISASEFRDFCKQDLAQPLVSIAVVGDYTTIGVNYSDLSERGKTLTRQTRNFFVPAAGMMVLLYALPRSLTGWEPFDANAVADKYVSNIKEGPEIEDNEWYINYIGHPYAGAAYYVVARHAGFNRTESFAYSAFMSTFFWEYGVEAVSEVPSIQDLIITPVFGAVLGEAFIVGEERIRANGGKVLGSTRLGNLALNLMDPAGWILDQSNRLFEGHPIQDVRFSIGFENRHPKADQERRIRLGIDLLF